MKNKETAWETWMKAGEEFFIKSQLSRKSIIELDEEAFQYAASRGLPHQDIIRRAFREGYFKANGQVFNHY